VALQGPNHLRKKVEEYGRVIFAFLLSKKATSMCHHPNDAWKEKVMCTEQGEFTQSHLVIVCADLDASMEKRKGEA